MMRQIALLGAVVVASVAASAAIGAEHAPSTVTWLPRPARTLAALDCRCVPGRARVARYQRVLAALSRRCMEPAARLAYISKVATEGLRQSGRRRTNLWMLTQVDESISKRPDEQPCRYVFALIVTSISP